MRLEELAEELEGELELTARRMAELRSRCAGLRAALGGTGQPPVSPPPISAGPPQRPDPPTLDRTTDNLPMPRFASGYVDPAIWEAANEEAPKVGLRPVTLVAIQVWESAWYTSKLFRAAWNVGGVKYRPDLPALGHTHGYYQATDGNKYAVWPSWRDGIAGHAQFLRQRRYDAVRQTEDAASEVRAIHDAGYAEYSQEWLSGITGLVNKFQKEGHS